MTMARIMIVLLSGFLLFFNPVCVYADSLSNLEQFSFEDPELKGTYTLSGAFNKTGTAEPNGTLFKFHYADKKFPFDVFYSNIYVFLGRTGEKTFEVQYRPEGLFTKPDNFSSMREHPAKINLYFTDNELYPLKINYVKPCTKEDKVYLKMLSLKGNGFDYQIILPDCLKKYIKIEPNK